MLCIPLNSFYRMQKGQGMEIAEVYAHYFNDDILTNRNDMTMSYIPNERSSRNSKEGAAE